MIPEAKWLPIVLPMALIVALLIALGCNGPEDPSTRQRRERIECVEGCLEACDTDVQPSLCEACLDACGVEKR